MAVVYPNLSSMDLSQIPSQKPPPGVIPNFVDPPTRAPITAVVTTVTLALMVSFVLLRLYADIGINRKLENVGWVCVIAMVAAISYCAVIYRSMDSLSTSCIVEEQSAYLAAALSQHSLGRHIWDVPLSFDTDASVQSYSIMNILYGPVAFLSRLSILMLYLRIFGVDERTRNLTYLAMAINFAQCLANIIGNCILCVPAPEASWLMAASRHSCLVTATLFAVCMAAISIANDFFILFIPLPPIWALQMSKKKKFYISAIFFTGLLVCVASILNLAFRVRQYRDPYRDNTWNGAISYMLTAVEINIAIMCSCMPSYATFVRRYRPSLRSLKYRLGVRHYSWNSSFRKIRSSKKDSNPDDINLGKIGLHRARSENGVYDGYNHPLTLGSAVRGGRFLETVDRPQAVHSQHPQSEHSTDGLLGRNLS